MKIQSLAIIFIIIIMPITIVLSEFVNNKITIEQTRLEYDTKLLNSTFDAIKAYQLNTINNAYGYNVNFKIKDLEAAANTLLNSLATNFNYTGYKAEVMKDYVPAIAFTLYDGYYIYSPFTNTLTGVNNGDYDPTYSQHGKIKEGLKPYVYYSCRYVQDDIDADVIITYTLDNYITITGKVNGQDVYDYGYIYSIAPNLQAAKDGYGIYKTNEDSYIYGGVEFKKSDTEKLWEYCIDGVYPYVKINGRKFYLEERNNDQNTARIFYIDSDGNKSYSQVSDKEYRQLTSKEKEDFNKFYNAIKFNKSAYEFYKNAYEFSKAALGNKPVDDYKDKKGNQITKTYGLNFLIADSAKGNVEKGNFYIFDTENDKVNIESAISNFNKHRKAVIRNVVETNLAAAISGFSSNANTGTSFIMPKISETNWDIIENDICAIAFLQGLKMGDKKYNGYAVVANTLTQDYIDENDIYILKKEGVYCKANDENLTEANIRGTNGKADFYSGIWKINFEPRKGKDSNNKDTYYNPLVYHSNNIPIPYKGSYTSIMGSSGLKSTFIGDKDRPDMISYIKGCGNDTLKKVYFTALGRERWGAFNINNINYSEVGQTGLDYFLDDYK